jgi:hypothetical protein
MVTMVAKDTTVAGVRADATFPRSTITANPHEEALFRIKLPIRDCNPTNEFCKPRLLT